jgi:molybdopterin-guanine dinucleotide biosynthesis protein A
VDVVSARGGPRAGLGALVLAGGRSARMGADKASIVVDGAPLLARTVAALLEVTAYVVVAARAGQTLPPLDPRAIVVVDPVDDRGPLAAIAGAEPSLARAVDRVFVASTDLPRFHAALVLALEARLGDREAVVPLVEGRAQPLAALYRRAALGRARLLVGAGERRATALVEACDARLVSIAELASDPALARLDPRLASLVDVDTPDDLARLFGPDTARP